MMLALLIYGYATGHFGSRTIAATIFARDGNVDDERARGVEMVGY